MKDKLHLKRPHWFQYLITHPVLMSDFDKFCKSKKRRVYSLDKLAYLFLLSTFGREWIRDKRYDYSFKNDAEIQRIAKVNIWKTDDEEDD